MNEAYNVDCMEYMKSLPDGAFDLAVVDPPYGDALTNESGGGIGIALEAALIDTSRPRRERERDGRRGTDRERTAGNRTEAGDMRTGGVNRVWKKYGKKSFRGTLRRSRNTLRSCFASHVIR